jgi:hypothetical protein
MAERLIACAIGYENGMATSVSTNENRRASRTADSKVSVRRRHLDDRRRELVSDTLAALRDGRARHFTRRAKSMETARSMLDRLRSS